MFVKARDIPSTLEAKDKSQNTTPKREFELLEDKFSTQKKISNFSQLKVNIEEESYVQRLQQEVISNGCWIICFKTGYQRAST